jgi:integrase
MEKARRKEITIEPMLWHHSKNREGLHPVKLKVTVNRETKYYAIQLNNKNIFLSQSDWDAIRLNKVRGELKEIKQASEVMKVSALGSVEKITVGGRPFSFERFEKSFFAHDDGSKGFMNQFKSALERLLTQERVGTYRAYTCSFRAFNRFLNTKKLKDISPYDLTVDFLYEYERHLMSDRGVNRTTVGIYMRVLRTIYNQCSDLDGNLKMHYPFGSDKRGKYRIQSSRRGGKKGDALTIEQLQLFLSTQLPKHSPPWEAKMYWLFSFYCQGMNFKDILLLKYSNIQGQLIRYTREKTKRTEDQEIIEIPLTEEIRQIIIQLGNEDKRPSSFVFPVLDPKEKNLMAIEEKIMQRIRVTNNWLEKICKGIGLPKMTTYWSRHSYASLLKMLGVSVELIRELLGHSDIKTTEHYLKRFDLDIKAAANQKIAHLLELKAS